MAIIFGTGFEAGHTGAGWAAIALDDQFNEGGSGTGTYAVGTGYKRTGNYGARLYCSGDWYRGYGFQTTEMPSGHSEVYVGFAYKPISLAYGYADHVRFILRMNNAQRIELRYQGDHMLDLYIGNGFAAAGAIPILNDWNFIEMHLLVHGSSGVFASKINGVPDIVFNGNTAPSGAASVLRLLLAGKRTTQNPTMYFDDVTVRTDAWTGDVKYVAVVPTADTVQKDFAPSTGSDNYAVVDEIPPSDSDYNEAVVNEALDLLAAGDFDGTDKAIQCVVTWVRAAKTPVSGQQVKVAVKSGSTTQKGSARDLSGSYAYKMLLLDNDPDTAAPWEDTGVDGVQVGYEAVI